MGGPRSDLVAGELEDPTSFPPDVRAAAGTGDGWERLCEFARMLHDEGELQGLIGPREVPRLWSRHIVNSFSINGLVPQGALAADVGSGAGFPGVVMALTRPDVSVTLIEAMERRCRWLQDVVDALGITNAQVVAARAEDLHEFQTFGIVTARALAPLGQLARLALPLVAPGGALLALKGVRAADEITAASGVLKAMRVRSVTLHEVVSPLDGTTTRVVELLR